TLEGLNRVIAENPDEIAKAIPNIRGFLAVTALSGEGLKKYDEILQQVNVDYGENSSLSRAFAKQEETKAQKIAKAKAALTAYVIENESLKKAILELYTVGLSLSKFLLGLPKSFYLWVAAVLALTVAIKASSIAIKGWTTLATVGRLLSLSWSAAMGLLTGNVTRATAAWKLMNVTMSKSAIGAIVATVAALGVALYNMYQNANKSAKALEKLKVKQEDIIEASKRHVDAVVREKQELNNLVNTITNVNVGEDRRKKLIDELSAKYPTFLKYLDKETIANDELQAILEKVNANYDKKYKLAALQGKADAYTDKIVALEGRRLDIEEELAVLRRGNLNSDSKQYKQYQELLKEDVEAKKIIDNYKKEISKFSNQIAGVQEEVSKSMSLEGMRLEFEQNLNFIKTKTEDLQRTKEKVNQNPDEIKYYEQQIKSAEIRKSVLERQIKAAEEELKKKNT
ncbi:MAG: hypothetical protein ACRCZB_09035, partial [Bacteroidales bacterium]